MLTHDDAVQLLADVPVTRVMEGPMNEVKRLIQTCLDEGIAATIGRKCLNGGSS